MTETIAGSVRATIGTVCLSVWPDPLLLAPPEIQSLVLQGRISDAVRVVKASYPGLLENSPDLLFKLRCRQFVEMIGGCDTVDLLSPPCQEPRLSCHSELSCSSGEGEEGVVSPPPTSTTADDSPFANGEVAVNGGGLEESAMDGGESAMEVDAPASTITAGESSQDKGQHCIASIQRLSLAVQPQGLLSLGNEAITVIIVCLWNLFNALQKWWTLIETLWPSSGCWPSAGTCSLSTPD